MEDIERRLRDVETLEAPSLRRLRDELQMMQTKIVDMDIHGTAVTQVRFENLAQDVADIKAVVAAMQQQQEDNSRWARRMVASAMVSGITALALFLLQFLVHTR